VHICLITLIPHDFFLVLYELVLDDSVDRAWIVFDFRIIIVPPPGHHAYIRSPIENLAVCSPVI
jgi:hypothetical protein